jgi:hypothetical protein
VKTNSRRRRETRRDIKERRGEKQRWTRAVEEEKQKSVENMRKKCGGEKKREME